jgi:hypothetical protein
MEHQYISPEGTERFRLLPPFSYRKATIGLLSFIGSTIKSVAKFNRMGISLQISVSATKFASISFISFIASTIQSHGLFYNLSDFDIVAHLELVRDTWCRRWRRYAFPFRYSRHNFHAGTRIQWCGNQLFEVCGTITIDWGGA